MRKWLVAAGISVLVLAAVAVAASRYLDGYVRRRVVAELRQRFGGEPKIASLNVTIFPEIRVVAQDVVVPPMVTIKRLSARTGYLQLLRSPKHVKQVSIQALQITIPPNGNEPEQAAGPPTGKPGRNPPALVVIDNVDSDNARLILLPEEAHKEPLVFEIYDLTMQSIATDRSWPFHASLKNATPPGHIDVGGAFGPWDIHQPRQTPLAADYTFTNANLGVFQGIGGTLASKGKFSGVLEHIAVDGQTDTPDFVVRVGGHPVNLHTDFHAIVDGTNGNTTLAPVVAHFLRTTVHCNGGVYKTGKEGRTVRLDVVVKDGRVEDLLRLVVKSDRPVMRGATTFQTKFLLPPGNADVMRKLRLDGSFGIGPAQFTSLNIQEKVKELSRKGQGEPDNQEAGSAVSRLSGRFQLDDAAVRFSSLAFTVEGAAVDLAGSYNLATEQLDFRGHLKLAVPLSKTTTGFKSLLLKLAEPFFKKKGGGTELPIKITGSRENPQFGLNLGH